MTKLFIEVLFYSGIIVCIFVPFVVKRLGEYDPLINDIPLRLTAVLLLSGVMALYILWKLRGIFKTILNKDPFIMENVNALRKIAASSFIISVTFTAKCLFWFTLATVLIVIIFAIAGLFCLVLADVFRQAVLYKQENDLTV